MILQQTTKKPNVKIKCLVLGAASAGKTSLIRRFFYKKFDFGTRVPTLGSDWYTASVESPIEPRSEQPEASSEHQTPLLVGIQMWDTPGRERFDAKRQRQQQRPIGDAFLLQADAVMLVYDMTSSTSFNQLLKWYRDMSKIDTGHRPPILVCANKLDLFVKLQQQQNQKRTVARSNNLKLSYGGNRSASPRDRTTLAPATTKRHSAGSPINGSLSRDVMGLQGQFRGKDIHYEYQVSDESNASSTNDLRSQTYQRRVRTGSISNSTSTQSMPIYLADRENWTSDGSYLESLLTTEDQSFPDIEMVKLWCLRNGLAHVESSAATGEGVESAFLQLTAMALKTKQARDSNADSVAHDAEPPESTQPSSAATHAFPSYGRNDPIDFGKRYAAPKEERCCFPILQPLLLLLRNQGEATL